jgi:SsrA-binding protein
MSAGEKLIASNKRAGRDYHILEKYEAGIVLQGTEVKSLRMKGGCQLKDSYAQETGGQLFLVSAHITPYDQGNIHNHEPERPRKLLMHKREIEKITQRAEEKGLTLVPLRVYFKLGKVKVELGLCKGKQSADKREAVREREVKREIDRAMKRERRPGS